MLVGVGPKARVEVSVEISGRLVEGRIGSS